MKKEQTVADSRIARDFSLWQLVRFTLPAVFTALCAQIFRSLDDGLFVSRFAGETALAAINILLPVNNLMNGVSNLFSIGACTLSAQKMGEGDPAEAKRIFSRICIAALGTGAFFALVINLGCEPLCRFLGADDSLIDISMTYARIVFSNTPLSFLAAVFASYYATAGRSDRGLASSVLNGAANIALDILFVAVWRMGVVGSSLSTVLGDAAVCIFGLLFFCDKRNDIYFVRPQGAYARTTFASWRSGLSQFIYCASLGITNLVTNKQLLGFIGSDGVAANSIIMSMRSITSAAFIGYAGCIGPILAYWYGAGNAPRLKKILSHSLKIVVAASVAAMAAGMALRRFLVGIYILEARAPALFAATVEGLTIEFGAVIFTAGCFFTMRMFVALGALRTASLITVLRNFVYRLAALLLLPPLLGGALGVWWAMPVSEGLSFITALIFVAANADNYGYGKSGAALRMRPREQR